MRGRAVVRRGSDVRRRGRLRRGCWRVLGRVHVTRRSGGRGGGRGRGRGRGMEANGEVLDFAKDVSVHQVEVACVRLVV